VQQWAGLWLALVLIKMCVALLAMQVWTAKGGAQAAAAAGGWAAEGPQTGWGRSQGERVYRLLLCCAAKSSVTCLLVAVPHHREGSAPAFGARLRAAMWGI